MRRKYVRADGTITKVDFVRCFDDSEFCGGPAVAKLIALVSDLTMLESMEIVFPKPISSARMPLFAFNGVGRLAPIITCWYLLTRWLILVLGPSQLMCRAGSYIDSSVSTSISSQSSRASGMIPVSILDMKSTATLWCLDCYVKT